MPNEPTKAALRRLYTEKAAALPPDYKREASAAIAEKLSAHPAYLSAKTVFIYIGTPREPDTAAIIRSALAAGKRVFVPRCGKKPQMDAVEITAQTVFYPNRFGIFEPQAGRCAAPEEIELTVVPCVAADKNGVRLGHGGGYYDVFLQTCRCPAVCLCFSSLLADGLPAEAHDVPVTAVITE